MVVTRETAHGYGNVANQTAARMLRYPPIGLASHWFFQSLTYMDKTELRFKLALDGGLAVLLGWVLRRKLRPRASVPVSIFAAHTFNFVFNGHLWGALKHYGLVNQRYDEFDHYRQGLETRIRAEQSVIFAAEYGSLARSTWRPSSDIDVRIVRRPGVASGLRACGFVLRERTRAMIGRFPLDIYVLDDFTSLAALHAGEEQVVLVDRRGTTA